MRVVRQRPEAVRPPAAPTSQGASEIAVVALAVLTGLVLAARPANERATPVVESGDLLPRAVAAGQAPPVRRLASAARVLPPPTLRPESPERREPAVPEGLQSP